MRKKNVVSISRARDKKRQSAIDAAIAGVRARMPENVRRLMAWHTVARMAQERAAVKIPVIPRALAYYCPTCQMIFDRAPDGVCRVCGAPNPVSVSAMLAQKDRPSERGNPDGQNVTD